METLDNISQNKKSKKETEMGLENVLVLQGGGSLGAYECGVLKYLYKNNVGFDVLAGSSIGAVNTSIITSAQNGGQDVAKVLEDFWLTLSQTVLPFEPSFLSIQPFTSSDKMTAVWSSMQSIFFGNSKAFLPKWFMPASSNYCFPFDWTYLYDTSPLKKTLKEFIDFDKLKKNEFSSMHLSPNNNDNRQSRLIITATDVRKGEPVVFDTAYMDIDVDKIIASIGYPFYGIKWSVTDERILWDGSLLTNTPLMEVFKASPVANKKLYIVDVFPREQKEIPENMLEVWHRARDIIFMDKTDKNIEMLKINERLLNLLKKIHDIVNAKDAKIDKKTKQRIEELDPEYNQFVRNYGAAITDVIRIGRKEKDSHYMLEDADFSKYRIKKLIDEGERDAKKVLTNNNRTSDNTLR
ncbi:MAG: patatin-like phospholipase family protein [Candidatus Nitrosocosmicus sp.]